MSYMKRTLKSKEATVAIEPKPKKPKISVSAKKIKPVENESIVSAPKIKSRAKKIKLVDSAEKNRVQTQKPVPPVSSQKTKSVKTKKPTTASVKLIKPPIKKVKPTVAKAKTKSVKPQPIVSAKQRRAASVKLKVVDNKGQKPKVAQTIKTKLPTTNISLSRQKIASPENKIKAKTEKLPRQPKTPKIAKAIENKIEPLKSVIVRKPRKKKVKPISSAIFRGKKDRYGFEVFSIDAEIEDVSAIYVISKRKTDKLKKGHHALVCIGQTESVLGEIKRHKKGKCVKKYQANVISILPEENEKKRLRIETDLKAAHTVVCTLE